MAYAIWDGLWWFTAVSFGINLFCLAVHSDRPAIPAVKLIGVRIISLVVGGFYIFWLTIHIPWAML